MPWPYLSASNSSSSASSSLGKPQTIVVLVAGVAVIFATYQVLNSFVFTRQLQSSDGLHRSNAVRRRNRTATNSAESGVENLNPQSDDWDQNEGIRLLMLDRAQTGGETVVDSSSTTEEFSLNTSQSFERNGQNIVQLLFRVSEDASKRNAYVHRGCACNCCGVIPIRGIRYRCANCADYDLCESCEAQGVHIKTHMFYKIRVPTSTIGPRYLQPVWYIGDPDSVARQLPKEILVKLSRETGIERPELDAYWEQWTFMANTDWRDDPHNINLALDRKTFERCLVPSGHASPSLIFDRMFAFYDTNKDDLIGFAEFLHGITYRKKKDKWKKIFQGYDIDGDGYVDRKDFLRIFRSYYVLYRTMHADILEGMVDQQMGSADTRRLINSRQPLSSAFGPDGRFPRAPNPRTGEGKITLASGDLEIIDGKGVINETAPDHGDRSEVFKRRLPKRRWGEDRFSDRGYWEMMLSPPETTGQLTSILRNIQQIAVSNSSNSHPALSTSFGRRTQSLGNENHNENTSGELEDQWPPDYIQVTDEDAEAVDGPGARVANTCPSSRRDVISHAVLRLRTQREIYDRWQRRNFYTDEEEGGIPPLDWKESDDVLRNFSAPESSRSTHPSNDSRSSSKVRSAEGAENFVARSSQSGPSRNIYDRWGVSEIPDAERDAGKEILYQVTQQAFNELLDPLFKSKEDLAIEAAATVVERKRFYHLYKSPSFEAWAIRQHRLQRDQYEAKDPNAQSPRENPEPSGSVNTNQNQVVEELVEAPELLVVDDHRDQAQSINPSTTATTASPISQDILSGPQMNSPGHLNSVQTNLSHNPLQPLYSPLVSPRTLEHRGSFGNPDNLDLTPPSNTLSCEPPDSTIIYDPTMPQFRPNSLPSSSVSIQQNPSLHISDIEIDENSPQKAPATNQAFQASSFAAPEKQSQDNPDTKESTSKIRLEKETVNDVSKAILFRFWLCDKAEKEAEQRGGWAKINFKEFDQLVKGQVEKEKSEKDPRERDLPTRMDYLGSWIEFCVP